jgi:hypothetical protein
MFSVVEFSDVKKSQDEDKNKNKSYRPTKTMQDKANLLVVELILLGAHHGTALPLMLSS